MKNSQLKRQITNKYGTLTRFCHLTGLNYSNVFNALQREDTEIQGKLLPIINRTPPQKVEGVEVTDRLINKVRTAIEATGLKPTPWAKANGLSPTTVSCLLTGKKVYLSGGVKDICDRLGVK
jgi:hypothetical protein